MPPEAAAGTPTERPAPSASRRALARRRDAARAPEGLAAALREVFEHHLARSASRRALAGDPRAARQVGEGLAEPGEPEPEPESRPPTDHGGPWTILDELKWRGISVATPDLPDVKYKHNLGLNRDLFHPAPHGDTAPAPAAVAAPAPASRDGDFIRRA